MAGLLLLAVTILRIITASSRRRWMPDGGFWLYALTFAFAAGANVAAARLVGGRTEIIELILSNIIVTLLLSPLVAWFVAIAVARPLAWSAAPWLRNMGRWWGPLIFWTLLLVTPLAVLHASIDLRLVQGVGAGFWPLALFDGALSTAMALLGLGLNAAAYRRVAES